MIEVQIPKDVSGYEAPLIGPLTSRQAICVAAAAAVEYIYYNIMNALNLGLDMNSVICIGVLLAAPILYLAIGKPYGSCHRLSQIKQGHMKQKSFTIHYWRQ